MPVQWMRRMTSISALARRPTARGQRRRCAGARPASVSPSLAIISTPARGPRIIARATPTAPAVRARCGGTCLVGSLSGSSRLRMSANGAVSTSSMAGAAPREVLQASCPAEPSAATLSNASTPASVLHGASSAASRNRASSAIACRRLGRDLGEGGLRPRRACPARSSATAASNCSAGFGGLLGVAVLIAPPAADAGHDERRPRR